MIPTTILYIPTTILGTLKNARITSFLFPITNCNLDVNPDTSFGKSQKVYKLTDTELRNRAETESTTSSSTLTEISSTNPKPEIDYQNVECTFYNNTGPPFSKVKGFADHVMLKYKTEDYGPNCFWKFVMNESMANHEMYHLLRGHNLIRNDLATNKIVKTFERGQSSEIANMRQLQWDPELSKLAQRWANQCMIVPDQCRDTPGYSVNQYVYLYDDTYYNLDGYMAAIRDICIQKARKVAPEMVHSWKIVDPDTEIYGLLAAADTFRMGCGRVNVYITNVIMRIIMVCNFAPRGNIPGSELYKQGNVTSKCPEHTFKSKEFPGLCQADHVDYEIETEPSIQNDTDFEERKANAISTFYHFSSTLTLWLILTTLLLNIIKVN